MSIKNLALVAVAAVALTGLAVPASAAIRYDFTAFSSFGFGPTENDHFMGSFSYIAPDFIDPPADTTPIFVPVGNLTSCSVTSSFGGAVCTDQAFLRNLSDDKTTVSFGVMDANTTNGIYYYFDVGAFTHVGSYDTVIFGADQSGHLDVTRVADTNGGVPEPGVWALMLIGFGGMGAALRARRRTGALSA